MPTYYNNIDQFSDADQTALLNAVAGEARGESLEGQKRVIHGILNRAAIGMRREHDYSGETVRDVLSVSQVNAANYRARPNEKRKAQQALDAALRERRAGTAPDDLYWKTPAVSPRWGRQPRYGLNTRETVGGHQFYSGTPEMQARLQQVKQTPRPGDIWLPRISEQNPRLPIQYDVRGVPSPRPKPGTEPVPRARPVQQGAKPPTARTAMPQNPNSVHRPGVLEQVLETPPAPRPPLAPLPGLAQMRREFAARQHGYTGPSDAVRGGRGTSYVPVVRQDSPEFQRLEERQLARTSRPDSRRQLGNLVRGGSTTLERRLPSPVPAQQVRTVPVSPGGTTTLTRRAPQPDLASLRQRLDGLRTPAPRRQPNLGALRNRLDALRPPERPFTPPPGIGAPKNRIASTPRSIQSSMADAYSMGGPSMGVYAQPTAPNVAPTPGAAPPIAHAPQPLPTAPVPVRMFQRPVAPPPARPMIQAPVSVQRQVMQRQAQNRVAPPSRSASRQFPEQTESGIERARQLQRQFPTRFVGGTTTGGFGRPGRTTVVDRRGNPIGRRR